MIITLDTQSKTVHVKGVWDSAADLTQELRNYLDDDVFNEWSITLDKPFTSNPHNSTGVPSLGAATLSGRPADFTGQ